MLTDSVGSVDSRFHLTKVTGYQSVTYHGFGRLRIHSNVVFVTTPPIPAPALFLGAFLELAYVV